jgi:hypothetical protein
LNSSCSAFSVDEEDLLQRLIHVVDAELSEAVLVEDLEVVDVRG